MRTSTDSHAPKGPQSVYEENKRLLKWFCNQLLATIFC